MQEFRNLISLFLTGLFLLAIGFVPPAAAGETCTTVEVCDFIHCTLGCAYYTTCDGGGTVITCVTPSLCNCGPE